PEATYRRQRYWRHRRGGRHQQGRGFAPIIPVRQAPEAAAPPRAGGPMSDDLDATGSRRQIEPLDEVLPAFLEAVEAGDLVAQEAVLAAFPDLAPGLEEFRAGTVHLDVLRFRRASLEGDLLAPITVGAYRLLRVVKTSLMGTVFRAEHLPTGSR